ncbi:polyketide cyclase [Brachybacterium sp. MASK1Z-5]|uniref:Polyketide cyclase n=1 Tax=Brachybacterium halotolerans TaxID=2795215 RepID=A0ABS1BCQ2_9MICO|nr:SRPBCC family protein [Brachybacterium halotolerans]MBK0332409.1 polyketide cyclase [Brachybacterium halotolerans]
MTTNETSISVSRTIDAPAGDIFDLLSLPARHHEFDGSGFVRSAEDTERITKVGEQFVMNMEGEHMGGEYKMYNHVTAFDDGKMIGWKPANEDAKDDPKGWEWLYTLESQGSDSTLVTLTYSWTDVTDKDLLKIFPLVSEEQIEQSLADLAGAVSGS